MDAASGKNQNHDADSDPIFNRHMKNWLLAIWVGFVFSEFLYAYALPSETMKAKLFDAELAQVEILQNPMLNLERKTFQGRRDFGYTLLYDASFSEEDEKGKLENQLKRELAKQGWVDCTSEAVPHFRKGNYYLEYRLTKKNKLEIVIKYSSFWQELGIIG